MVCSVSTINLNLAVDHTAARHGDSHITIGLEATVDVKGHATLFGDDSGVLDHDVAAVVAHHISNPVSPLGCVNRHSTHS